MPGIDVDTGRENFGATGWLAAAAGAKAAIKLTRAGIKITDLMGFINLDQNAPLAHASDVLDKGKKLLCALEIPEKLFELKDKAVEIVAHGPSVERFRELVSAITNLWSSLQDGIELFYIGISSENAMLLEKIGGVMLDVGMSCLLWKDIVDLTKKNAALQKLELELARLVTDTDVGRARAASLKKYIQGLKAQMTNKMLKVAQWVSYFVLGALIIAAAFFGCALGPWMLAASTTALVLNIIGHFHNVHVVEPIFQPELQEEPELFFSYDELREYHKDEWNRRPDGEVAERSTAGGVTKLPPAAEQRLRGIWGDNTLTNRLGWTQAAPVREVAT